MVIGVLTPTPGRLPENRKRQPVRLANQIAQAVGLPFLSVNEEEEERTGSRKQDRSLSSNRVAESAHRQKRHSGQDSNGDPEQSGKDDSAASRKGKAKKVHPILWSYDQWRWKWIS